MNEKKARKLAAKDAAYRAAQGQRADYEAELDAKTGRNQGAGAAKRHTSNSSYDWRRLKQGQTRRRYDEPASDEPRDSQAAPAVEPQPNKPGLMFGGRAKPLDEMRQQRRTDNGV